MPNYKVKFFRPDLTTRADVSFTSKSDWHAKQQCKSIAKEVDSTRSRGVLTKDSVTVCHFDKASDL